MKFKLLFSILFIVSIQAFSQTRKGQFLTGGNINYSYKSNLYSTVKINTMELEAIINIGYFVANNFAVGVLSGYNWTRENWIDYGPRSFDDEIITRSGNAGLFFREYLLPNRSRINILLQESYRYGLIGEEQTLSGQKTKGYNYYTQNFAISGGPVLFLNEHTSLELLCVYDYETRFKWQSFLVGLGFQIHLGKGKLPKEKSLR